MLLIYNNPAPQGDWVFFRHQLLNSIMCDTNFRIGYNACVREAVIDSLMAGNRRGTVAKQFNLTWPTVSKWLTEYKLAESQISLHLEKTS